MTLRSDHIAGAAFMALGVLVWALSGDLPFGTLANPGSGFLPKLVVAVMVLFGLVLVLRAGESEPFATIAWSDLRHAAPVVLITAAAIAAYTWLGFVATFVLMLFAFLVLIERKPLLPAALYSIAVAGAAYLVFAVGLKAPLPAGPWGL